MDKKPVKLPAPRPGPTPEELLARRERMLRVAPKFGIAGALVFIGGLAGSAAVAGITWYLWDSPTLSGSATFFISGLIGVGLLNMKWRAMHEVEKIDLALRKLARQEKGLP